MNRQLIILLSIVFIDLAGFGVVIPLIPQLVTDAGGDPFIVGLVIGLYSLFQFIFTPVWGRLSDRFGRKPILALTMLINVVAYGVIYLSPNLWILMLGRVLGGIGTGNLPVVYAYVADTSTSHERTKRMALISSMFGLGFIVGPVIGGVSANAYGNHFPFLLTAILSLINAFFVLIALPESNKNLQKDIKIELINIPVIKNVLRPKNMSFLIFLFFLTNVSLALIIGILPLFSAEKFGWGDLEISFFFAGIGIGSFFTQSVLIRFLLKKWNEVELIKGGMILFGLATICMGLAFSPAFLIISGSLSAVGFSLMNANLMGLISLESGKTEQGIVMGVAQSFAAFARVLGPITGGAIALLMINLPYYASGLVIFLVFLWGRNHLKFMKDNQSE